MRRKKITIRASTSNFPTSSESLLNKTMTSETSVRGRMTMILKSAVSDRPIYLKANCPWIIIYGDFYENRIKEGNEIRFEDGLEKFGG